MSDGRARDAVPPTRALADGLTRDVSDRLAAAKLWLVSTSSPTTCGNLPYLATALYALIPVATNRVRDMTADRHWRLYLNPMWVEATDIPVVAARMAHVAWHLLAQHPERADDLQVRRATAGQWRLAADATVAEVLTGLATGLATPADLCLPAGRSAEEYFAVLSGLPAEPDADPDRPDDAEPRATEPPDERQPDGSCGGGCDGQSRDYELPVGHASGAVGEADADEIRRRVAIEFREHQARMGTRPGEWSRWATQILDPVVPWTQVLAAAVRRGVGWAHGHTDYTYTRISRRQAAVGPVILPATRRPVPEVAIVVDTSGSIDDGLLAQALGEVDGVLTGLGVSGRSVTVLATDAAVHAVSRIHSAKDARMHGGGGTDMRVGIATALELRPRPTLVVVLTDGYTPWPEQPTPIPVVAVVIGRQRTELPRTPEWAQRVECLPD
jgi:predicted metal-dependent peptidase